MFRTERISDIGLCSSQRATNDKIFAGTGKKGRFHVTVSDETKQLHLNTNIDV